MASPPILLDRYLVFPGYVGPNESNTQTWVLPPGAAYGAATPTTALSLPMLYIGTVSQPTSQSLVSNDDFVIDLVVNGGVQPPHQADVDIKVQLTGKNAWSTAPAARAALRQNFLSCIQQIESKYELSASPWLIPGATSIIAGAIVQNMPLPLTEVLLYACGLESGFGTGTPPSVDVIPGMRLRCEPSVRQYVAPPNQAFSGYVASGSLGWDVASSMASGTQTQVFDAFLGSVASPQITPPPEITPQPSTPAPVYNLTDLQSANTGYKYHRLIYPENVIAGSAVGNVSDQQNVQLVGANNLTDLRTNPPYKRIFFGRDVVIPEICIWFCVTGTALAPFYVPLGTTVNNMLERFTRWKPLSADANDFIKLIRFGYSAQAQALGSISGLPVAFAQPGFAITDLHVLDLPLWPGDALFLQFTMS